MSTTIYIIIILTVVFIYLLFYIAKSTSRNRTKRTDSLYTSGLNHMLHDENDKAIECFKEYLKVNTKNLDAYIKLGVLLRNSDQKSNALNIHENLLFRQELTKGQKIIILTQVCEDLMALKQFDKAILKAREILKLDKGNPFATENLYKLLRDNHQWEQAIEYLKKNQKISSDLKNRMMTVYKVQEGFEKYYKKEKYHDARLVFRKAIKIDPTCETPYYYMGLSYIMNSREKDAITWWEKFVEVAPQKAHLVFPDLKRILFNLGKFEELNTFLGNILKKSPDNIESMIALVEFYENKGDINKAISVADEYLKSRKHDIKLQISMAKLYSAKNGCRKSVSILNEALNNFNSQEVLTCSCCGHIVNSPIWFCTNCREIDTFLE